MEISLLVRVLSEIPWQCNESKLFEWFSIKDWAIGHLRDAFCLCIKTSLSVKLFTWKCVSPTGSFSRKSSSFTYERFCTRTRFETEAQATRKWPVTNWPRSIYQYSNMALRLSGQTSIFGVVSFVSLSLMGIEGQKRLEKFAILTRKPRSHAWILIYRTWPICRFVFDGHSRSPCCDRVPRRWPANARNVSFLN